MRKQDITKHGISKVIDEPGDTFGTAESITEGEYDGRISQSDEDYYAIDLTDGDVLEVEVQFQESNYEEDHLDVDLYDPNEDFLESDTTIDAGAKTAATATQTGTHYIKIDGADDDLTENDYSLFVNRIEPAENDVFQPNYNFNTAASVTEGSYSASIVPSDHDYYAIDLNDGDVLEVELQFQESNYEEDHLDVDLYDPNEDFLESDTTIDAGAKTAATATQTGTYYIEVQGTDNILTENDYSLFVNRIQPAENDAFQPNYNFNTAASVTEGSYDGNIVPSDHDYYAIDLNDGDVLDVAIHFDETNYEEDHLDVDLYDPNEDFLESDTMTDAGARTAATATQTGTYYIEVQGTDNILTENSYTLSVNRIEPTENDAFQPNYNFNTAVSVTEGSYSASIVPSDHDYYAIDLTDGDVLEVEIHFDETNYEEYHLDIDLYDPNEDFLESDTTTDAGAKTAATATQTGTYYIEVQGTDNILTENNYTLSINRIQPAENDAFQPNYNFNTAVSVTEGSYSASIVPSDHDYYAIAVNSGGTIDVDVQFDETNYEEDHLDVDLYDPNEDFLESDTTTDGGANVAATASQTGTHYIKIQGTDDIRTKNDYTMSVTADVIGTPSVDGSVTINGNQVTFKYQITNEESKTVSNVTLNINNDFAGWSIESEESTADSWDVIDQTWTWNSIPASTSEDAQVTLSAQSGAEDEFQRLRAITAVGDTVTDLVTPLYDPTAPTELSIDVTGDTIGINQQAKINISATYVDSIILEDLWADWTVNSSVSDDVFIDLIAETGKVTLKWDSIQYSVSPVITITPPNRYVGGTYQLQLTVSNSEGDSATKTTQLTID
ncbi:hypothetical protein HZS55_06245 [Halosimplex rubrum]|uniref:Pre-peptidase C-terminal domain-containing protein n=1 Tax=Halosimplex rubrum TaxID=869889 RepID=A0A7D5P1U0_9EURY|nr:hypothetical protein [Halosimplex rubrum]QLH76921.1 hypothetical protein HZS55_06245 [Halosimplex rubrum]